MKLIYAIINRNDENSVVGKLNQGGFSVTKLATTGGFLRSGNTTLLIGTDEDKVDTVIETVKQECGPRKRITVNSEPMIGMTGYNPGAVCVDVGGVTIFVVDVERFEKI